MPSRIHVSSGAYRLFTVFAIGGFIVAAAKPTNFEALTTPNLSVVLFSVCKVLGASIVPGFLIWRNYTTIRRRQPMIPTSLQRAAPWYYRAAIVAVWLQLVAMLLLPLLAVIIGYSTLSESVAWGMSLGNLSAAAYWFAAPTVFTMEVASAYHRDGGSNIQLEPTTVGAARDA